jgi:hypothetical protein
VAIFISVQLKQQKYEAARKMLMIQKFVISGLRCGLNEILALL